jgi:tocopherol O-methyltransferase
VAGRLAALPVSRVLKTAAGTGAVTRRLAATLPADVPIVATDLNRGMLDQAEAQGTSRPVEWRQADAMQLPFEDGSFDVVVCQFGVMFLPDKSRAFAEARRVLRPGGGLAVCAWIAADGARGWRVRHLLEPICREGRLAGMGSEGDYRALLAGAGLLVTGVDDLTQSVKGTWPRCARALAWRLLVDPRYRRFIASARSRNRVFAATLLRIWAAYESGAMRYLLITARRPAAP